MNPILGRELLTLLRSRLAFVMLAIYVAASAAVVLAAWPKSEATMLVQGQISRDLFWLVGLAQTLLVGIVVPATLAPSLTSEKEAETLDLLLTTPMTAHHILFGKFLSGLTYFVVLLLVSVPIVLLCYVLGGLSSADVAGLYLHLAMLTLVFGPVSVNCSIFFHRTHIALIVSYLICGGTAAVLQSIYGDGVNFLSSGRFVAPSMASGTFSFVLYSAALARIRRPFDPVPKSIEEESPREQAGLIIRPEAWPDRWLVAARGDGLLEDEADPLYEKEGRSEIYGSGTLFVRWIIQFGTIAALIVTFFVLAAPLRTPEPAHAEYPFFCFMLVLVMCLGPAIAAGAFTQEKEHGTLEALVLTMLPRRRIILGKFKFILRFVLALAAINTAPFVIAVVMSTHHPSQLLAYPMCVIPATVATISLGLFISFFSRTTTAATIGTYGTLFVLFVGPVLAKWILERLTGRPFDRGPVLDAISPFLACYKAGEAAAQLEMILANGVLLLFLSAVLLTVIRVRFDSVLRV
jgi:ABC-type transport system involved in multi-copper enzyme maturation permease subunit